MVRSFIKNTIMIIMILITFQAFSQKKQFKALLFTKTAGWHHTSVHEAVTGLRNLADRHFFDLDWQEDAARFNDEYLKQFDVVIFLMTTMDILNEEQQEAFKRFIQSGKGYVGIHSAADTEYDWDWYRKLVGRMFHIHPVIQTAVLNVENSNFPGMELMPKSRFWTDEWYEYGKEEIEGLNYLVSVDEKTYDPNVQWGQKIGKGMGDFHPLSWYHEYDGGRSFYTGLGHVPAIYSDLIFMEHVFGGIYWAATGKGIKK